MPEEQEITQLTNNQPTKLTEKTDFFNTIPKAKTILSFIETFSASLEKNKLIALYGDWGSGKTSIIKYLIKELSESYITIKFEAWKCEKDKNLASSLLFEISKKLPLNFKNNKKLLNYSNKMILSMAKSLSFNFGPINFSGNTFLNSFVKESLSFIEEREKFEVNFKKLENEILANEEKRKKIIIFIDELDRCEPENILNLLTAIKHFFSNGEKTIFFCGIDKDAVTKAVKHKYQDIVKSEEYLEKIFDISFNMPKKFEIFEILKYYFKDKYYDVSFYKLINDFFTFIDFTTPRHIKKVLNKYLIVKYIKSEELNNHELIPEISSDHNFNIVLVLYFIILFEFNNEIFNELQSTDFRKSVFFEKHHEFKKNNKKTTSNISPNATRNEAVMALDKHFGSKDITISEFFDDNSQFHLTLFSNIFLPLLKRDIDFNQIGGLDMTQFEKSGDNLQTGFCYFYMENHSKFVSEDNNNYKIYDLFKMAKTIL